MKSNLQCIKCNLIVSDVGFIWNVGYILWLYGFAISFCKRLFATAQSILYFITNENDNSPKVLPVFYRYLFYFQRFVSFFYKNITFKGFFSPKRLMIFHKNCTQLWLFWKWRVYISVYLHSIILEIFWGVFRSRTGFFEILVQNSHKFEYWQSRGVASQGFKGSNKNLGPHLFGIFEFLSFYSHRFEITSIIWLISSSLKQDTKECTRHRFGNSASARSMSKVNDIIRNNDSTIRSKQFHPRKSS